MTAPPRVRERVIQRTLLGIRFRDQCTGVTVSRGLSVCAYRAPAVERRIWAIASPSGGFVFPHIPGLGYLERGDATGPAPAPFVIEVEDRQGRFLPLRFAVSPPEFQIDVPLYSAPARQAPQGFAVLRADLWDAIAQVPAAWAVIEAHIGTGAAFTGIADAKGRLALLFPWPAPPPAAPGSPPLSPPNSGRKPLREQEWTVELAARYRRSVPVPDMPGMPGTLAQPWASLWSTGTANRGLASPPGALLTSATLEFGKELVARSARSFSGEPMSELLITSGP